MVVAIVFVLFCLFVCLFHFQGKGRVMRMKGDGLAMGLLSKAIVDRSEGLKKLVLFICHLD